jgi:hypothetical protein
MKQRVRQELFEEYRLAQRVQQRAEKADEEIVFDFADRRLEPELPVLHDGQLVVYPWGNRGGTAAKLPKTGWCRQESLEAGKWRWLAPQSVVIPADFGLEKGVRESAGINRAGVANERVVRERSSQPLEERTLRSLMVTSRV